MDKKTIAQGVLEKRKQYDVLMRAPWDSVIHNAVMDRLEGHQTIALYAAFNHEVDTYGMMETLFWDDRYTICLPKIKGESMDFYTITGFEQLQPGVMGILEPTTNHKISADEIDVVIVPMVAFNRQGYRIGYGGGYYDRFLKGINAIKIGVAYSFQETDIPFQQDHDIRCDVIITENAIMNPNRD
ncbi:5-formyltetrahydrofolate cyclo-ligase [Erysipelothrix sp. strain 2 (EsS2-7-Brazil)]|uniref:5-formyltetrahydrofolate cyclo-ligase n=1 Tax=Erysipelothrix sp. strain 2 (EsS2-7-Brazil) TaxID=2500579 RepID=UPI00190B4CAB|nr:5-formyltetrahydrofolate cyclo-ligase [Erysipelothrix sp. strain 2 (EsS2-7-Brazil)]MBK2404004.1 5-formyltetrahydrofolate cyclo-ligase [Erysipelothrix sp. strain 2 (EsS2-7-Brazil)]